MRFSLVLVVLFLVASSFFVPLTFADVGETEAVSALTDAERTIVSAYQAVLKADAAGANVSSLLVRLNEAGKLLARAQAAYKSGDFDSTLRFATQSQEKLNGFVADAQILRETAIRENYVDFVVNVVGSIIGAIGVVCVGFLVWFFLNRKYEKAGKTT